MTGSWDIIFWKNCSAINYVPSSWANKDRTEYKWPTGPSRPGQPAPIDIIRSCLDITKNYSFFPANFKITVKTIEDAEKYTRKAEAGASDLEGSDAASSYSSVSSFQYLQNEDADRSSDEEAGPTRWKRPNIMASDNLGTVLRSSTAVLNDTAFNSETDTDIHTNNVAGPSNHLNDTPTENGTNLDDTLTNTHDMPPPDLTQAEKYLIQVISLLKHEVQELRTSVTQLQTALLVSNRQPIGQTSIISTAEHKLIQMLPAKTKPEFEDIENLIVADEQSFNLMVDMLYLVGGDNYKSSIYECLKKLLTSEVSVQYSGQGKVRGDQKKGSFCNTRTYIALKAAMRRRFPYMTDAEYKDRVATFLRSVKDRDGSRKKSRGPDV